uniref:Uncharacterized protein n=2 Tax=Oryza brachyantha TaxID=4533 RepID=J3LF30_ORYBR
MLASYRAVAAIPELIDKGFVSEYGIPILANGFNEDQSKVKANLHAEIISLFPAQLELSTKDLPWLVGDAATQKSRFTFWLRTMERARSLRCILVNSFPGEAPGGGVDVYHDQQQPLQHPQILPVGPLLANVVLDRPKENNNLQRSPLNNTGGMCQADRTCVEWLDQQLPGSVTYVSFGTWVAPIAPAEITELAAGLEATGRPFLWVLKDDPSWRAGLPAGYAEAISISGHGKIVAWAPQDDVLAHGAVGCYLTHCGWNSTLEAIRHGVRMLCYPMAGDQFINCAYIVRVWEIGFRLGSTNRGEVERCVGRIMEGEDGRRLQEKMDELRERVMAGEASSSCVAKRNIEAFVDGIKGPRLGLFWDNKY